MLLFILNKCTSILKEVKAQCCDLSWYLDKLLRMTDIVYTNKRGASIFLNRPWFGRYIMEHFVHVL